MTKIWANFRPGEKPIWPLCGLSYTLQARREQKVPTVQRRWNKRKLYCGNFQISPICPIFVNVKVHKKMLNIGKSQNIYLMRPYLYNFIFTIFSILLLLVTLEMCSFKFCLFGMIILQTLNKIKFKSNYKLEINTLNQRFMHNLCFRFYPKNKFYIGQSTKLF